MQYHCGEVNGVRIVVPMSPIHTIEEVCEFQSVWRQEGLGKVRLPLSLYNRTHTFIERTAYAITHADLIWGIIYNHELRGIEYCPIAEYHAVLSAMEKLHIPLAILDECTYTLYLKHRYPRLTMYRFIREVASVTRFAEAAD